MIDKSDISPAIVKNAEIIFTEFYYSVHGHVCEPDIWVTALSAWKAGNTALPMVDAAFAASYAIETGIVRTAATH